MRYAITGSIGTGKTTVADVFRAKGMNVYDADKMVHDLYEDDDILIEVKKMFPEAFIKGTMDKKVISDIIFQDKEKKKELEDFIHPLVRKQIEKLDNCFVEVPLLYESKMEDIFDKVILVYCDKELQIKRLRERNNYSEADALARINSQMDINEKRKYADIIIDNDGSMENINKQVDDIITKL